MLCTRNITLRCIRATIFAVGKKYYILWVCFCSLRYPAYSVHAPYCHLWPICLQYFSTLSHKWHDFFKNVTEHNFFIFSATFVWNTSHSQEELSEIWSTVCIGLHVKSMLFISDFNETWIFLDRFSEILSYQISLKSVQWEPSCTLRTDGQKLVVAFCNFADEPKKNALHRDLVRPSVLWPGMSNWTVHWIFVKFSIKNSVEKVVDQAPVSWKSTQWPTYITYRSQWIYTHICHIYCLILAKFGTDVSRVVL